MDERRIARLTELGATRGQAITALQANKWDVVSATDRYFEGTYDHLLTTFDTSGPSGSEVALGLGAGSGSRLEPGKGLGKGGTRDHPLRVFSSPASPGSPENRGMTSTHPILQGPAVEVIEVDDDDDDVDGAVDDGDDGVIEIDDDDDGMDDDEGYEGYEYGEEDDELEERQVKGSDPYANIFYSKERTETTVQVEEPVVTGTMERPIGPSGEKKELTYKILSSGEWMGGCAEMGEQGFLFQLYYALVEGNMRCVTKGCTWVWERSPSDFFAICEDYETTLKAIDCWVTQLCPRCGVRVCLACEEAATERPAVPLGEKGKLRRERGRWDLLHCPNIQGVIIGIGLHLAERLHAAPIESKEPSSTSKPKVPSKRKLTGTGNSGAPKGSGAGTGYAGAGKEDQSGVEAARLVNREKDDRLKQLLEAIRVYLPNHFRPGGVRAGDSMIHSTVLSHLRRKFNQIACTLLQSESISDVHDRETLFVELMHWFMILSHHDGLGSALAMPHMRVAAVTVEERADGRRETTTRYECMASPRELLERLVIQCKQVLRSLDSTKIGKESEDQHTVHVTAKKKTKKEKKVETGLTEGESSDIAALRIFCGTIIDRAASIDYALAETKGEEFVKRMQSEFPKIGASQIANTTHKEGDSDPSHEDVKKRYIAWVKEARFDHASLGTTKDNSEAVTWDSCFATEIAALTNGTVNSKRALSLAKEIGTLSQNLPAAWESSIFIRVDEVRMDVIKAMIIGPEGSPYWNGCFLFDIFLPKDYNSVPPKCKIVSTHGGRHRFGPNLYADGKVCLSLLGTWSGPGWQKGSTLLQVLISIQALILGTASPIACEPGHESDIGTARDEAYNCNIRRMTVNSAMIELLQDPPSIFKEEIRGHFRLKKAEMAKQIDDWEALDDGGALVGDSMIASRIGSKKTAKISTAYKANLLKLKKLIEAL